MTAPWLWAALAAVLALGLVGTGVELLLIEHHEDETQLLPLLAIGLTLAALTWHARAPRRASRRSLQVVLCAQVATGLAGVVVHARANAEFQRELDPSLEGWRLWRKTLQAKAPPALAPGVLAQLGLVGLIYAARPTAEDTRS